MSRYHRANSTGKSVGPLLLPALIAVALALSSCGKADVKKASSQIAARVNGEEISVHQIAAVLARSSEFPPGQARQAATEVLERIIDQELLVQRALQARLDRDPQVMRTTEDAKRQILVRAYVERAVSPGSTESREEVGKFYRDNPALFEQRRIYHVHEIRALLPPERLDELRAAVAGMKALNAVADWLKFRNLAFQAETSSKPAEQIPLHVLPQLIQMRQGQISVFPAPRGASVLQLMQSAQAPLSEQQAAPIIERYLASRKRLEATRAEVRKLRERAKIEYVGEFDGAARPAAAAPSAAPDEPGSVESGGHIERGLAGLR